MPRVGVLTINFGEPAEPSLEGVTAFLERVFAGTGAPPGTPREEVLAMARAMAAHQAPALTGAYQAMGGSPFNGQADALAGALEEELGRRWRRGPAEDRRGAPAAPRVYSAFQFTPPFMDQELARAREEGVDLLVALPVSPLCARPTTLDPLEEVDGALAAMAWGVERVCISGWHHHPAYRALRAEHVRRWVAAEGLDLRDPDTLLYFSAHGTPVAYLEAGSRYDRYVEEQCRGLARALGADRWTVGFQNHAHRGLPWTEPENRAHLATLTETHLVVDPVSFLFEQSETLGELDHQLRGVAESLGKTLHRVPVPHDDPGLPGVLADLVEEAVRAGPSGEPGGVLRPCTCRPLAGTFCTNGGRDLPPSPFTPSQPDS